MTKKTIIMISAIVFVLLFTFFSFYLYKSTLIIKSIDKEKTVSIDDKIYKKVKEELKLSIKPGKYKIIIKLENYNDYESEILIKPFAKKEVNINLTETNESVDRRSIEEVSRKFIKEYNTYSKQTDQEYFNRIKPYMENTFFDSETQLFLSSAKDFINQSPVEASVSEVRITNYSLDQAKVEAKYTNTIKNNNKVFELNSTLLLTRKSNSWLVYAIK